MCERYTNWLPLVRPLLGTWPTTQAYALTRNRTSNLLVHRLALNPLSLRHFECNGHTVHMLTQWHLPPPLTSTVKSSLFTPVHSSPLPLAARLHQCHTNHSHYINNGWTFLRQTQQSDCSDTLVTCQFSSAISL